MLKYARGCVEINSIGNILLLPAIGKAVKENHNSYNVEIHKAQAYGNLRLLLPLTRRVCVRTLPLAVSPALGDGAHTVDALRLPEDGVTSAGHREERLRPPARQPACDAAYSACTVFSGS
ncbi:hypothetical protein R6Z07F_001205 [Ovis aries]